MVNLKEYIYPEMDILFLALNAPVTSNAKAHWFSRNLSFWNVLYNAGLITDKIILPAQGDIKVFGDNKINFRNKIYGVTDLNNEVVETKSSKVTVNESHLIRVKNILDNDKVRKLCLVHSDVGKSFRNSGYLEHQTNQRYGLIGFYRTTKVYEVPFHNASIPNKEKY